jgi:SAM-dependent methyltransferase
MVDAATAWDEVYRNPYGRRYPFEPLVVYVHRLRDRGFAGTRALDIGFGTVADLIMLGSCGFQVIGLEVSKNAIARAERALENVGKSNRLDLWKPGTPFDYESGSFDLAIAIGSLHYNLDQPAVLSEIARVIRPGGRFMATYHGPRFHHWKDSEVVAPGRRRYGEGYGNPAMRGLEFVYFERADQVGTLYDEHFVDVEVSHYHYTLLGQEESLWLVTAAGGG